MEKRKYVTPRMEDIGAFEEITKGTDIGDHIDQAIPVGFPVIDIPGFVEHHLS